MGAERTTGPSDPFDRLLEHLPLDLPAGPALQWEPAPGPPSRMQVAHARTPAEPGRTSFLSWSVRGPLGGLQFEAMAIAGEEAATLVGVEVGLHSPRPLADGRLDEPGECPVLTGPCWYRGSTEDGAFLGRRLAATELDDDVVWAVLLAGYRHEFVAED